MEFIKGIIDVFVHLDKHLHEIIANYGTLTYIILFTVILIETGLVIVPFLPGDSLLFATGAIAAKGSLDISSLFILLVIAGIIGDTMNYHIGKYVGPKIFEKQYFFLKQKHIDKTKAFYEKYGGKTIIIARFIPIVRSFAPFLAGIGTMNYRRFILYNIIGCLLWVGGFLLAGYFLGNLPAVKKNFTFIILGIIIISLLPPIIEILRNRKVK